MASSSVVSRMAEDDGASGGITSFGFLHDVDEQQESSFALGSLFSRVKTALGAGAPSEPQQQSSSHPNYSPQQASSSTSNPSPSHHSGPSTSRSASHSRKISASRSQLGLSTLDEHTENQQFSRSSPPSQTSTADFTRNRRIASIRTQNDRTSPNRQRKPDTTGQISANENANRHILAPSPSAPSLSSAKSSAGPSQRYLPLPLRTVAPAPTVTFTSPAHATTHRSRTTVASSSVLDDQDSVLAEDGEEANASRDHLGALRNTAVDHSHWAAHGWSAIPGFPLSKDILADDARSIHSSSSRFPRSEANEESHFGTSSRSGVQTSADAVIRRIRGEGLSKKFWMADENAKECRECLTVFTPFRRKHHCRICGQIFCGRCASHIIKGTRFGYDGMVRVCNFCMRMLEDYDRHAMYNQHAAISHGQMSKALRTNNRILPDKEMISAPLEAQVRSPQAQFAANHLFANANAGPGAFDLNLPKVQSFASALNGRDSDVDFEPNSAPQSPSAPPKQNVSKQESTAGSAAPFRKGLADDEMAHAPAAEEEAVNLVNGAAGSDLLVGAQVGADRPPADESGKAPRSMAAAAARFTLQRVPFPHGHGALSEESNQVIMQTNDYPRLRLISDAASRHPTYRTRLKSRNAVVADASQAKDSAKSRTERDSASPVLKEDKDEGSVEGPTTPDLSKDLRVCMLGITPALLESSVTPVALDHVTTMLEQMLVNHDLSKVRVWLDVLLPIVLTAVSKIKPNPRESDRMDVRQFIKIKRIPGGKPTDCEYVDGFVCSKNVATKKMGRGLPLNNARIMVVKFQLDYHRGPNQFMSLEPLMAQEREFIHILVARVVALRPQIIVVEKTVSKLALDLLEKAGITVVWSMKPSAIGAISRCTQADIITSIDRLALDPKIGRCHHFAVETYEHASFPEKRKTFMRFEGTPKDLGCTIILRGADGPTLSQLKRIVELMIFVAYNLRLEEHIMKDEGAAMDTIYHASRKPVGAEACSAFAANEQPKLQEEPESTTEADAELSIRPWAGNDYAPILAARKRIERALRLYQETAVSSSACINLSPPYPIMRLKKDNDRLMELKEHREAEELQRILKDEGRIRELSTVTDATDDTEVGDRPAPTVESPSNAHTSPATPTAVYAAPSQPASVKGLEVLAEDAGDEQGEEEEDEVETPKAMAIDRIAFTKLEESVLQMCLPKRKEGQLEEGSPKNTRITGGVYESAPATPSTSTPRPSIFGPSLSEAPTRTTSPAPYSGTLSLSQSTLLPTSNSGGGCSLINADLFSSLHSPSTVAKEAEFSIAKERHAVLLQRWRRYLDVRPEDISPFNHQRICMLTSNFCAVTQKPCEGPSLTTVEFYSDRDETLGGHLEDLAHNSSKTCPIKGCGRANVLHYHTYVHNQIRIQVVLERFVCPVPGEENRLLSWSYCKVCENATPVAMVTQESWSFSFAKYLEMYFYRHDNCKTKLCDHDFYKDQVRYFAFQNLAVRFHSEEVELYEVAVPGTKLFISPETQSNLKNEESVTFSRKNQAYWDSVLARIKGLGNDACSDAAGPNKERNRIMLSVMIKKCEADRREIEAMVARTYRDTAPTDVLCLNNVRRALQEKVVKWDVDFIEFEKTFLPSEKDIRRITTTHLKRLFAEKDPSEARSDSIAGSLPPAAELDETAASSGKTDEGSTTGRTVAEVAAMGAIGADFGHEPMPSDAAEAARTPDADTPATERPSILSRQPSETKIPIHRSRVFKDDDDTDATDLSPSESRLSMLSRGAGSVTMPSSPTYAIDRSRGAFFSTAFPRADESSCTESEIPGSVSSLIRRFGSPRRTVTVHPNTGTDSPSSRIMPEARRPGMRRGKTEEVLSPQGRRRELGAAVTEETDTDLRQPGAEVRSSRASSPSRRASQSSQSRVPRIKRGDSSGSVTGGKKSGSATPTAPSAPPSSFRPPRGEGLKAGPRPVIGRSGGMVSRNRGSDSDRPALSNGRDGVSGTFTGSTIRGAQPASGSGHGREVSNLGGSRVPVARRMENGPGTRSRVSTIAKHFDRISREAERERERQHRMLVAQRAKRARPVAMTRAKVEVFNSIKDAVRDDESECDSIESEDDGASAADNEDEGDDTDGDDGENGGGGRRQGRRAIGNANLGRRGTGGDARQANRDDSTGPLDKAISGEDTVKASGKQVFAGRAGRQEPSTIKASSGALEALRNDNSDGRVSPENTVAQRRPNAGSELESDAQSIAASVTGSTISSTLPSYLRNGIFSDSDSTISLERSFLKTLSGFWAFRSGEMVPLEYPMLNSEHVFGDSEIIFREDEPSSIVAFTLSSTKYNDQLRTMQNEGTKIKEKEEAFMPGNESVAESDGWGMIDVEGNELESVLKKEGRHFRCEFESGSTKLWCKILFAEQFDALRRSCSCEHSFLESLSRCVKWDSSGGKSGSAFLKTRDDRFVVKQLSRFEMDAFSKFAPQYFNYMSQCFSRDRQTTLAKIFGCFRIGFKNPQTGKSLKMDCLVMENLFYGREITKIYDLKGSMRNRHIQETGKANEVLLDENLVEIAHQSPLFVREHSKRLLRSALYNDSLFLADMNVMDYSLVVGLDKKKQELVVGIIDFVRTFTWDKRVESFVKETALLGGGGKGEPTIITPRQYRIRFLTFLDKSFLLTPDYWVGDDWTQ